MTFDEARSFNYFLYYGEGINTIAEETVHDLVVGLLQPKRSMFYNRSDGAGVPSYRNKSGFQMQIGVRFDIVSWISRRNFLVSAGEQGFPDRRAYASQDTVTVDIPDRGSGEANVSVNYVLSSGLQVQKTTVPMGGK